MKKHKTHHDRLDTYPGLFKQHEEIHQRIDDNMEMLRLAQISQLRAQMIHIYEQAQRDGELSVYWKEQFYDMYKIYKAMGGNGFIEQIKSFIDEL